MDQDRGPSCGQFPGTARVIGVAMGDHNASEGIGVTLMRGNRTAYARRVRRVAAVDEREIGLQYQVNPDTGEPDLGDVSEPQALHG